jgi:hypothetical protein
MARADSALRDTIIGAISEMSCDRLADWSSATTGYRSPYPSSYTHVYNQQKEVS